MTKHCFTHKFDTHLEKFNLPTANEALVVVVVDVVEVVVVSAFVVPEIEFVFDLLGLVDKVGCNSVLVASLLAEG